MWKLFAGLCLLLLGFLVYWDYKVTAQSEAVIYESLRQIEEYEKPERLDGLTEDQKKLVNMMPENDQLDYENAIRGRRETAQAAREFQKILNQPDPYDNNPDFDALDAEAEALIEELEKNKPTGSQ